MARTWLVGWLSLSFAWLSHEIITFGINWGYLTGERQLGYGIYPSSLQGIILEALAICGGGALLLAAFGHFLRAKPIKVFILASAWLLFCIWGYVVTAYGYRSDFGATWRFHEPFWGLMYSVWMTPLITVLALGAFVWALRE